MNTLNKLGPGIMFAAMAIGISHLVQSTRAGADYGLVLAPVIVFACILKYPLFRFAASYGAITGNSLFEAYRQEGKFAVIILVLSAAIDLIISTAAVTLVTAGLIKFLLQTDASVAVIGIIVLIVMGIMLATSRYKLIERGTIILVFVFVGLVLIAFGTVAPLAMERADQLLPTLEFSEGLILFIIAMMGWMPNPPSGSFVVSAWAATRKTLSPDQHNDEDGIFDLNVGYWITIIMALAFVVLGAALLFGRSDDIAGSPVAFAGNFIRLFSETIGPAITPFISLAAVALMISTLIGLMDGVPRLLQQALARETSNWVRQAIIAIQIVGAGLLLVLFQSSFRMLIDFATSVGFVLAPLIAYYNYRAMVSDTIPAAARPAPYLIWWNWVSIILFAITGVLFIGLQNGWMTFS